MFGRNLFLVILLTILLESDKISSEHLKRKHDHRNAVSGAQRTLKSNKYSYFAFLSYEAPSKRVGGPCTCVVIETNVVLAYGNCFNSVTSFKDVRYFVQLNEKEREIKYYAYKYQFTQDNALVLLGTRGMPQVEKIPWFTDDVPKTFNADELNFFANEPYPYNDTTFLQGAEIVKLPVKNCNIGVNNDFFCQTNGKVGDYCQYGGPLLYKEKVLGIWAQKYLNSMLFPDDTCAPGDTHEFLDLRRNYKYIQDALVKIRNYQ